MRWSREEQQYTDTEEGYTAVQLYGRRPEAGAWEVSRASRGLASVVWRLRARSADRRGVGHVGCNCGEIRTADARVKYSSRRGRTHGTWHGTVYGIAGIVQRNRRPGQVYAKVVHMDRTGLSGCETQILYSMYCI